MNPGETIFELEHEMRSVEHEPFPRRHGVEMFKAEATIKFLKEGDRTILQRFLLLRLIGRKIELHFLCEIFCSFDKLDRTNRHI